MPDSDGESELLSPKQLQHELPQLKIKVEVEPTATVAQPSATSHNSESKVVTPLRWTGLVWGLDLWAMVVDHADPGVLAAALVWSGLV